MFEDLQPEPDWEQKYYKQKKLIDDLEKEVVDKERQLRDTDSRLGEYLDALNKSRELLRRYFDKHGKDIFEEWAKEQEKSKPKVEVDLLDED